MSAAFIAAFRRPSVLGDFDMLSGERAQRARIGVAVQVKRARPEIVVH